MIAHYPVLASEIAKRGMVKARIAKTIGISPRTFYDKLNGKTSLSWDEACAIQETFFPDMSKDALFNRLNRGEPNDGKTV